MLQWTLGCMHPLGSCFSLDICPGVELQGHIKIALFFKEPPYCSPEWLHQFTLPPTVLESSLLSTPSTAFIVCALFDGSYSGCCEVVFHWSFHLQFTDDKCVDESLFGSLFHCLFITELQSSLWSLDTSLLSDIQYADVFSHSVLSFHLLIVSFKKQRF